MPSLLETNKFDCRLVSLIFTFKLRCMYVVLETNLFAIYNQVN